MDLEQLTYSPFLGRQYKISMYASKQRKASSKWDGTAHVMSCPL